MAKFLLRAHSIQAGTATSTRTAMEWVLDTLFVKDPSKRSAALKKAKTSGNSSKLGVSLKFPDKTSLLRYVNKVRDNLVKNEHWKVCRTQEDILGNPSLFGRDSMYVSDAEDSTFRQHLVTLKMDSVLDDGQVLVEIEVK